jgi:hypothetical protein
MEGVEGLMKNLKLSEAEKRRVRFHGEEEGRQGIASPKAFGKLLSEKEARADVVEQAVRRIWCPMKGSSARSWETILPVHSLSIPISRGSSFT